MSSVQPSKILQTLENCCKLCDNKAELKLIEMLSESTEVEPDCKAEPGASSGRGRSRKGLLCKGSDKALEHKERKASSLSNDETIIPDSIQAQILPQRS